MKKEYLHEQGVHGGIKPYSCLGKNTWAATMFLMETKNVMRD
ncbi:MAG: hypothetical protein ACXWEY_14775 [Bacteroidia bacterium]